MNIIKNFKNKILDNVMVPLGHPIEDDPSKNVGEVTDLGLSPDKEKLIATISVKEAPIVDKIRNGLIRGISASIAENYIKKDTGEAVGPVLFHAALVGEPYVKGMAGFVPLSEELKDSVVVQIMNMEEPLTLSELSNRIKKIEDKLNLNEESLEEETSEEISEEVPKEPTEEVSKEEASEEETAEEETESPKVGEEAEEEEKESETEESETEEPKTEESETKTEEAEEGVDLADAESLYEKLLGEGKVFPAEKELLIPLLASKTEIELSDNERVASGKALFDYLMKQVSKIPLSEEGSTGSPVREAKDEEIPPEIDSVLEGMHLSEDLKKAAYKEFKEGKEQEEESTPF
jgi:DNA polymerase III alpha subunit (gram-positive type)